jgi:hypothetical protein
VEMTSNPFTQMLREFGPNGENWIKKAYGGRTNRRLQACLIGAARWLVYESLVGARLDVNQPYSHTYTYWVEALRDPRFDQIRDLLAAVISEEFPAYAKVMVGSTIANFNDSEETTWADVRTVLEKAAAKWDERV